MVAIIKIRNDLFSEKNHTVGIIKIRNYLFSKKNHMVAIIKIKKLPIQSKEPHGVREETIPDYINMIT